MSLDVFAISALVDEFLDMLAGGKVQDSIDVDETGLGLEIYSNHHRYYLYMSADNNRPTVYLAGDKLRRGVSKPTQLGLLFRRYVENGRVLHISQPPWDRILNIEIEGPEGVVEIIVEPMERRSNILLVKGGIILDAMRRVGPQDNRYRLSLPAHEYVAPPPQVGKRNPFEVTREDMAGFFQQTPDTDKKRKTFQVLTGHLLGISPTLAREIVYRASEEADQKATQADPDALYEALVAIMEPLRKREWQPGVVEVIDGLVETFSVYPLTHVDGWRRVESVSEAVAAYYGAPVGEDAYNNAKAPVREAINEAKAKLKGKLASLERSMTDDEEREVLRKSGELILAYQYTLTQGQMELKAQYDLDAPEFVIKLDPTMTPLENAQRYFSRYDKAKRALDDVPRLIEETKTELGYLDQLDNDLSLATNWPDIDEVQEALLSGGYIHRQTKMKRLGGGAQSAPIRIVTGDAYVIWVGRNSRQNEIVTFKRGGGEDLWLHARDVPGAHVVIKFDGRNIPEHIIEQAASLAAYYSARRTDGKVPVDVTRCKYVKKIKGAAQGMVTYRNETTVTATPRSEKAFEDA
ncbi:MAG: NFACT RNA binding domain-containing protein [Anaerolineae bacterium]